MRKSWRLNVDVDCLKSLVPTYKNEKAGEEESNPHASYYRHILKRCRGVSLKWLEHYSTGKKSKQCGQESKELNPLNPHTYVKGCRADILCNGCQYNNK